VRKVKSSKPSRPDYYAAIYAVIRRIPLGKVATYGQIARLARLGRGARMVGRALRNCTEKDRVPWQRVINAQGRISMRRGAEGEPETLQRALLEREGVRISDSGRIDLDRHLWDPSPRILRARS
jgi:methylated-DNA-protein-cysteine methyltransferase-like protein